MTKDNEKTIPIIESEKLYSFLENNQLVQANAIAQKLEGMLQDIIVRESKPEQAEEHKLWPAFKAVIRIKSRILSGFRDEAKQETVLLAKLLRQ